MENQNIILSIKQTKLVRIFVFPIINFLRCFRLFTYQFTNEAKRVRKLKSTHKGERCFIIGNGPSLTIGDLDKIKDEYCFAANRIYRIFDETEWRPQSYLCVDSFVYRDIKECIGKLEIPHIFVHLEGKKYKIDNARINYVNNYYPYLINQYKRVKNIGFSADVSHHFVAGETVTYNAIQLAVYMGFKDIYLLGIDHNYSKKMNAKGEIIIDNGIKDYFGDLKSNRYSVQNIGTSTAAFCSAKKYCKENQIIIKNVTKGGKLEVFERSTLDEVLKGVK